MHTFRLVLSLFLLFAFAAPASAQNWPTQPVRIVVPYPPGGAADILARKLAERLGQRWKQTVVVENKPGGVEVVAATAVAIAPPDGYTLLFASESTFFTNQFLQSKLPYDTATAFTPLTRLVEGPMVYVVRSDSPYQTMQQFVAAAKTQPGKLSYGSNGPGGTVHLAVSGLSQAVGELNLIHVPYRGAAPTMADLMGGIIHLAPLPLPAVDGFLKDKRVRALAITGNARLGALPDVPTLIELGYKDNTQIMFALAAPARLAPELAAKISGDVGQILRDRDFVARDLEVVGLVPVPGTPAEFAQYIEANRAVWLAKVTAAKLVPN